MRSTWEGLKAHVGRIHSTSLLLLLLLEHATWLLISRVVRRRLWLVVGEERRVASSKARTNTCWTKIRSRGHRYLRARGEG